MGFMTKLFGPKSNAMPIHVTDANFRNEVLNHDGPLLLDIWGPGCAPCQRLIPVMQAIARQYDGQVKVCELNAAESPKAASKLGVRGTPTIVVYRRRSEIGRVVGYHPKSYFDQMIETEFSGEPEVEAEPVVAARIDDPELQGLSKKAQKKREKKARQEARVSG
jgi:thioredoxin 1